jgi:hypothetical protein
MTNIKVSYIVPVLTSDKSIHFTIGLRGAYKAFVEIFFEPNESVPEVVLNIFFNKKCVLAYAGNLGEVFEKLENFANKDIEEALKYHRNFSILKSDCSVVKTDVPVDIKQYLPYCVGQECHIANPDEQMIDNNPILLSNPNHIFELDGYLLDCAFDEKKIRCTIIPHMRKLSSLTEEEARELVVLHYGESYREELTKEHYYKDELRKPQLEFVSIIGYMVHYRAWGRSNEFGLLTKYNFEQFHYLTTIGIAWWATEEMWESGAIIEIEN